MKKILTACVIMSFMGVMRCMAQGACDIPIPEDGKYLCTAFQTGFSLSGNTITIHNPTFIPASFAASYNVSVRYFDEVVTFNCVAIECPSATISASGSDIVINLGDCASIPSYITEAWIIHINMFPNGGGDVYWTRWTGGCWEPLETLSAPKMPKRLPLERIFLARK